MPVQKHSAMDPGGTWQMDARDQTAMWNADRGDRINMWQTNRMDQRGQDDWRKEVALKQLGLTEQGMNWNREDTAAERAAKYGYMGEELGMRRQSMESDNDYRKRMIALQESDPNRQMGVYALDKLKGRDAKMKAFESSLDPAKFGFEGESAEAFRGLVGLGGGEAAIPVIGESMRRAMEAKYKPQDLRNKVTDTKTEKALEIISQYQGNPNLTPQQFKALKAAEAVVGASGLDPGMGLESGMADPVTEFADTIVAIGAEAKDKAGGAMGYASDDDIQVLTDKVSSLRREMKRQGYDDAQIKAVMDDIGQKMKRVGAAPWWARVLTSGLIPVAGVAANALGMGSGISDDQRTQITGVQ
jgi:hypothetical protein